MNGTNLKSMLAGLFLVAASGGAVADPSHTGLLEDLERERAALLRGLLQETTGPTATSEQQAAIRRLADMERIVLRDDGLVGDTSSVVRRAFDNYELTFLVHASTELGRSPLDVWLEEVGLSTDAVLATRPGRRL